MFFCIYSRGHLEYHTNRAIILVCWVVLIGGHPDSAAAQSVTTVHIVPESINLGVGEISAVDLQIRSVTNMYGFELHLRFDPTFIQIVDADSGETGVQIRHGDLYQVSQGFLVINQVDNLNGQIVYAFTLLAPSPPMSGDGVLVSFDLQALAIGSSEVKLEQVILASPDGEPLPYEGTGGEVHILAQGASATPGSATEIPVASPSPPLFPTQIPESTKTPAETIIVSPPAVQTTLVSTLSPTQTSFIPGSTAREIPADTPGESGLSADQIQTTVQMSSTTGTLPAVTDLIEATLESSGPDPGSTQSTWMVLLAIALIIFFLGGIIILTRTSLPHGRKPARRPDSDD